MPYPLDLTVSVLRRLYTNGVDRFTPEGRYVRALYDFPTPVVARATQLHHATVSSSLQGDTEHDATALALVCRMLAVDCDLMKFNLAASHIPWLAPLLIRMQGVKPPFYPTLWDTRANAIIFQQVSLRVASAVMQHVGFAIGQLVKVADLPTRCSRFALEGGRVLDGPAVHS